MKTGRIHWPSVLQFSLSALAVFILWSGALMLITVGVIGLITGSTEDSVHANNLQYFVMSAVCAFIGALALPSTYYALWRVLGLQVIDIRPVLVKFKPALWILYLPAVLLVGYWISRIPWLTWLVLPIMHLLAVGLPVAWILYLSVRNLPLGSSQRMWGVFNNGLLLAPSMALVLESLAGIVFLLLGILFVSGQPGMVDRISRFAEWMNTRNPTPELLLEKVYPLLVNPVVIFSVVFFGAVIVPLIEEAIKPIGAWFLVGKKLSPAAGFAAGAVSGAAYAMFETLVLASDGQQWVTMMVTRIGTAIIHIFTSGLVGWALVQVRYKRRYGLLYLSYLTAVAIHGLWNSITLFYSFSFMAVFYKLQFPYPFIFDIGWTAPWSLTFLAAGAFITLLYANRSLRHPLDTIKEAR